MVSAFLRFARYCHDLAHELKADAYVAHGVEAMPAADIVARTVGGCSYCDVIETPSFRRRGTRDNWYPSDHAMLDHAVDSYLRGADGISTTSWAQADEVRAHGRPVTVIPNYRYAEELRPSEELREKCGLGPGDVLLLASSTIYSGFEPVIEALKLLPQNVHLATLSTIVAECRERLHTYPAEIGVEKRVHFFDEVPYERLTTVASGANLGLMALNTSLHSHRTSLPNRLFDSIAAGLPIVTPDVPDIARLVTERQIGVIVASNEAYCWAEAIKAALAAEREMRPRVRAAAKELCWEALGDKLHATYGYPTSVTILGFGNLVGHQRTLRMTKSFVARGASVTICCPRPARDPPPEPGVRFVFTPNPLAAETTTGTVPAALVEHLRERAAQCDTLEAELVSLRFKAEQWDKLPVPSLLDKAEQYDALQRELPALRQKAEQFDVWGPQLPDLRLKAERYDSLEAELPAIRYKAEQWDKLPVPSLLDKAEQFDAVRQELPELRYKAEQFDEWGPQLPDLRLKAERHDSLEAELPALRYKAEQWDKLPVPSLLHKAEQFDALQPELPALRHKSEQFDALNPQLPALFYKAQAYDVLKEQLPPLRYKAERYDALEQELPILRHKAERQDQLEPQLPELFRKSGLYDRLEDQLPVWHAKENWYDRIATVPWRRRLLRILGMSIDPDLPLGSRES